MDQREFHALLWLHHSGVMGVFATEEQIVRSGKMWTFQSFLTCLILNSILLAVFFVMANQILTALNQWVSPLLAAGNISQPADAHLALMGLSQLIGEAQKYLASVVFGVGLAITLVLWLVLLYLGGRLLLLAEHKALSTEPGNGRTFGVE